MICSARSILNMSRGGGAGKGGCSRHCTGQAAQAGWAARAGQAAQAGQAAWAIQAGQAGGAAWAGQALRWAGRAWAGQAAWAGVTWQGEEAVRKSGGTFTQMMEPRDVDWSVVLIRSSPRAAALMMTLGSIPMPAASMTLMLMMRVCHTLVVRRELLKLASPGAI